MCARALIQWLPMHIEFTRGIVIWLLDYCNSAYLTSLIRLTEPGLGQRSKWSIGFTEVSSVRWNESVWSSSKTNRFSQPVLSELQEEYIIKGVMSRSRVDALSELCSPLLKWGNSICIAAIASVPLSLHNNSTNTCWQRWKTALWNPFLYFCWTFSLFRLV